MDARKQRVLQAIIDDYIRTAEPVGSRTLARTHGLGVSPATIRNEMADLEEMGYLEQPHTSAGRVPSDKGYRYYVDCLISDPGPEEEGREAVRRVLAAKARLIEDVVRQAARLLAEMTDCLALASQPDAQPTRVRALRAVPLGEERALLILVAEDGTLRSKTIQLGTWLPAEDLERIALALSSRLEGAMLGETALRALRGLQGELGQYRDLVDQILAWLGDAETAEGERLVVDGEANLFKQPEFRDVAKAHAVLAALEREELVNRLLDVPPVSDRGAVGVVIGREMNVQEMEDCSLVTAVYLAPGRVLGRIGVLGPRRMDYRTVMRVVEEVAGGVTEVLGGGVAPPRHFVARRPRPARPKGAGS
jgi:heat-inducible transcriptional repressor